MKSVNQMTLAREGSLSGIGIHTGESCAVTFKPAPVDSGVRFFRDGRPVGRLSAEEGSVASSDPLRCSFVGEGADRILTVEHLLASLRGLGLTNLVVDVRGPEIPALDGSALPFVRLFRGLGLVDQGKPADFYRIQEPIFCYDDKKAIAIYPSDDFSVSYVLDYDHPHLRDQKFDFSLTPEGFESQVAPARTFCTDTEARELQRSGFGRGASPENTLVVAQDGSHVAGLRFADECVRHKVLDILGDFSLLGYPVLGRVVAVRSGHTLNRQLVQAIKKQREAMSANRPDEMQVKLPMELEDIKKILPHREPFLFVDRILAMTDKTITGVKQVTGKEDFFRGHFPQRAVMPGVLMVEAIAQVGGVLMLSKPEHRGKLAFLASVNNARFRRIVSPGDTLQLDVEIVKYKARIGIVKGTAKVGDEVACEVEIMFSLAS